MTLDISIGLWDYDRIRPMIDGSVKSDGVNINWVLLPPSETIYRMMQFHEFDVSEVSLSAYVLANEMEGNPFAAIPVFPVRSFRHRSVYINKDSGIESPEDLKGKVVGTPRYRQTASVWIRGMLSDEYGVRNSDVSFVVGGTNQRENEWQYWNSGEGGRSRDSKVRIEEMPEGKNLSTMLENGEIDALYSANEPKCFVNRSPKVARLFPDYEDAEKKYYQKTGIFPIMHVVVMRKELYEKNRWLAASLFKSFLKAKEFLYNEIYNPGGTAATKYILPWALPDYEKTRNIMGEDFWPYGVEKNRKCLETFIRYSHEQGLAREVRKAESLFAPETVKTFA